MRKFVNFWSLSVLIIYILFVLMNWLTPMVADDYHTMMHMLPDSSRKIESLYDVIWGAYSYYFSWGGRMVGYLITTALSYMPPYLFDLANAAAYMLVVTLIYKICMGAKRNNFLLYLGIHILLWISVPDYGQVMFWLCGAGNYLWPSLFVLLLIYVFRMFAKQRGKYCQSAIWCIPLFVLGVVSGWAMENMSAGMLVILTFYLLWYKKNKIHIAASIVSAYVGSLIGFAFLVLAPGNRVRAAAGGLSFVFKFSIISYYWVLFVGILCIIWLILRRVVKAEAANREKALTGESLIYVAGSVSSAYCMLAAPSSPERTWFIVCVYAIVAVGIYFSELDMEKYLVRRKGLKLLVFGAAVYCLVQTMDTMLYSYEIYTQTAAREVYIEEQKAEGNLDLRVPIISHKYPLRARHDALTGLSDIQEDPAYWINVEMAKYFGVNSITGYEQ